MKKLTLAITLTIGAISSTTALATIYAHELLINAAEYKSKVDRTHQELESEWYPKLMYCVDTTRDTSKGKGIRHIRDNKAYADCEDALLETRLAKDLRDYIAAKEKFVYKLGKFANAIGVYR